MGITRGYGHSISREYCTNNIDGFEAVLRKMISSLRGRLHKSVNTVVASYVSMYVFLCIFPVLHPIKCLMCQMEYGNFSPK